MNAGIFGRIIGAVLSVVLLAGCEEWKSDVAPEGHAIVREHAVYGPRNDPPIFSTLDFTILEIDGGPVVREVVPRLVDIQHGALVTAGKHTIKVSVSPHARRPGERPAEMTFEITVASGKVYYLVGKDGGPFLAEARVRQP